jgi:hypothetical protein
MLVIFASSCCDDTSSIDSGVTCNVSNRTVHREAKRDKEECWMNVNDDDEITAAPTTSTNVTSTALLDSLVHANALGCHTGLGF